MFLQQKQKMQFNGKKYRIMVQIADQVILYTCFATLA